MAAFMLATLISALFAIPAQAASPTANVSVSITSVPVSGSNVKVLAPVVYTITVTNLDTVSAVAGDVTLTDDVGLGTWVSDDAGCPTPPLNCANPLDIAPGGTWVVHTTVNAQVAPGSLVNTPTVAVAGDVDLANNTASSTTTVVATLADVTIAKSHTGAGTPGSDVTYSLQVNNAGPDTATGIVVTDSLNASLTFKSSASGCTAAAPPVVSCNVADILAAGSATVTFVATIGASVAAGTVIPNTASVTTTTPESNGTNNTSANDPLTVGAASVDLGVTLAVAPTTAAPGDTVTYTVTVTNPDTVTDATNVVVTDALPVGLTAVTPPTAGPTGTTTALSSNTWTLTIPTVAKATGPSTPTVVTASFDAVVDAATTLTTITNTVTMTATQTDPTPANNTASVDLTISADVADLNVVTAVDDSKPNQGDTIQIYIQVSNAGPADATNIVLKDVLPTGLKYVSCLPSGCDQTGVRRQSSQQFSIPSVLAGSADQVVLSVVVQASQGTLQNTASVVSFDQTDPTAANNNDSLSITIGGAANNPGGSTGGTGGTGGTTGGTGGTTAFTGFTAGQLMPWFMLLFSLGLVAIEWSRRMRLVSPIGSTYGFEPFQS